MVWLWGSFKLCYSSLKISGKIPPEPSCTRVTPFLTLFFHRSFSLRCSNRISWEKKTQNRSVSRRPVWFWLISLRIEKKATMVSHTLEEKKRESGANGMIATHRTGKYSQLRQNGVKNWIIGNLFLVTDVDYWQRKKKYSLKILVWTYILLFTVLLAAQHIQM